MDEIKLHSKGWDFLEHPETSETVGSGRSASQVDPSRHNNHANLTSSVTSSTHGKQLYKLLPEVYIWKDEERVYHAPEGKPLNYLISSDPGGKSQTRRGQPTRETAHKPGHQKVLVILLVGASGSRGGGGGGGRKRRRTGGAGRVGGCLISSA